MAYLRNPYGRIVAVEDGRVEEYLNQRFERISQEEQEAHIKERTIIAEQVKTKGVGIDHEHKLYYVTVTQGGADGYGTASQLLNNEFITRGIEAKTYYEGQKVSLLFHNPYSLLRIDSLYRIIYTMFESDKIPDEWIDYLKVADLVIVPSRWCQKVFQKSGIQSVVVPLGYDEKTFVYKKREKKNPRYENFTFLHYNAFNARKGFLEVFKAFEKAFQKDEPVKMIFKTTLEHIPLPITTKQYPNIKIVRGKLPQKKLVDLLHESDCFVFPSRGEGFGITPLEAMATGIPAIIPNAHGITEYFDSSCMYEAKIGERCPALYSRYKGQDVGEMIVCDVDALAQKMRYVYEHQDEAIAMGERASEYVKKYTIQNTAQQLIEIIKDVYKKPIAQKDIQNVLLLEKII